jgi:uncharacterized membrane protein YfcA
MLSRTIGVLMLVMLAVILLRPRRWLEAHTSDTAAHYAVQAPIFFVIGAYGGFIQAGVGIFLLAGLVLASGYNLVGANAIKNFIVLLFTLAALAVFVINDQVRWGLGLLLAVGNAGGAWVAARMAVARGAPFVRYALIAILLLASIALLAVLRISKGTVGMSTAQKDRRQEEHGLTERDRQLTSNAIKLLHSPIRSR